MGIPKELGPCSTNPTQRLKAAQGEGEVWGFSSPSERKQGKTILPHNATTPEKLPIPLDLSIPPRFPSSQGWLPQVLDARAPPQLPAQTIPSLFASVLAACLSPEAPSTSSQELLLAPRSLLHHHSLAHCHTPSLCACSCQSPAPGTSRIKGSFVP